METNPTHSYSWTSDIGGFSSSSQNPTVTPTTAGNYTYTVTVTNNAGCTATASVSITVNACTGTEESEMKNAGLQFFPNPTTGMINLNEAFTLDNDFEVSIYNSFGELIIQKNNVTHIDLSPYAIGIYYIIVKTSDKELIRKKVVLIK